MSEDAPLSAPDRPSDAPASLPAELAQATSLESVSLGQLSALLALQSEKTLTAAALKVGKNPSTVLRMLRQLEVKYEIEIYRVGRDKRVTLTDRGLQLCEIASGVLKEMERFRALTEKNTWRLRIGGGAASLHSLVIPNLLEIRELFEKAHPVCRTHFANLRSEETVARLNRGQLDFGIVRSSAIDLAALTTIRLGYIGYMLVVQKSEAVRWGLHGVEDFSPRDDRPGYRIVTLSGMGEFKRELMTRLEAANLKLLLEDECDFFSDVLMAVRCNPVAGIVPATALSHEAGADSFAVFPLPFMQDPPALGSAGDEASGYGRDFVLAYNPKLAAARQIVPPQIDQLAAIFKRTLTLSMRWNTAGV
jgi:DNA-binding transcriptional LysR family regulator